MASGGAAARRYARAFFGLAQELGAVDALRRDLATLAEVIEAHPSARDAIFRPLHPAAERKAALVALAARLGGHALLQSFLQLLIDQRRLIDFEAIRAEYERLADQAAGRVRAQVSSASPLEEAQIARLRDVLGRRSGREVELALTVDPALLGGIVAKLGDIVFDGSLRTQLHQLRATLTKED